MAMADHEGKICRYFNTLGGCWYGQQCKFLHIPNQKPPCKFFFSSSGCRFGDACHFSHDRLPLKSVENSGPEVEELPTQDLKSASAAGSGEGYQSGTNNNSMYQAAQQFEAAESEATDNGVIYCTTCHKTLQRQDNESYYNLLRDHYLGCFFEKDADHIKNVRVRASMEFGALYSCKVCNLVFEKPWSLFQHCTDKAKAVKSSRLEKKLHNEWLDEVAGSMAAYDLGLFPPNHVRDSLRENIAPPAVEEEIETATNALNMCMLLNYMLNGMGMNQAPGGMGMVPNGGGPMQRFQQPGRTGSRPTIGRGGGPRIRRVVSSSQDRSAAEKKPDPACGDVTPVTLSVMPDPSSDNSWGFSKEEVGELMSQGIKPWDAEAPAALAALRGEYDYLLSQNIAE